MHFYTLCNFTASITIYNSNTFSDATAGVHMSYSSSPPVLVDEVQCTKSDTRLRDCNYTKTGFDSTCRDYHGEATVSCFSE